MSCKHFRKRIFGRTPEPEREAGILAIINQKLDWIIIHMAKDRKALDDAVAQIKQDAADASQRWTTAFGAFTDKLKANGVDMADYSAEVDELTSVHNEVIKIAGDAAGTTSDNKPTPVPPIPAPSSDPGAVPGGIAPAPAPTAGNNAGTPMPPSPDAQPGDSIPAGTPPGQAAP